jgi:anti-sigma B factor antagonist
MQIVERAIGEVTILDLKGRLVAGDGDQLLIDAVNRLVQIGRRKVLLNLADVSYIDSGGLGAIVAKYITLHKRDGQLKLCNVRARSFRVLNITRLLTIFESFDSEADALRGFDAHH